MLGSISIASAPSMHTDNATAQSSSPRPQVRRRGLSYLRSYTQAANNDTSEETSHSPRHGRSQSFQISSDIIRGPASSARTVAPRESSPSPGLRLVTAQDPAGDSRIYAATASQAPTGGWLPSVDGSQGLSGATTQLQPSSVTSRRSRHKPTAAGIPENHSNIGRNRAVTSPLHPPSSIDFSALRAARRVSNPIATDKTSSSLPSSQLPSIQLVPYQDPRSTRPSLNFQTTTRTLPDTTCTIRVGRYSERDTASPPRSTDNISDAPVGFKSKVVSRRHCEFFYQNNQWHIKDVKSSSGTFLNHIRLSPPGEESRPFAIKDGDLVQLGIDFKGGEEMIFRCVKIRILCNRGWQKSVNKFNKSAHKRLNDLQRGNSRDVQTSADSTECSICINHIAPCQALFVAPCSHTWHYKCIRPMLEDAARSTTDEQQFTCPNCRDVNDLDADVDDGPAWDEDDEDEDSVGHDQDVDATHIGASEPIESVETSYGEPIDITTLGTMQGLRLVDEEPSPPPPTPILGLNPGATDFIPASASSSPTAMRLPPIHISQRNGTFFSNSEDVAGDVQTNVPSYSSEQASNTSAGVQIPPLSFTRLPSPPVDGETDGPLTPRNNAGPFVFDGGVDLH